jgi:hypothetical protein
MQAVGKAVAAELPAGYGFFVLAFPFLKKDAACEYVSNGKREDVVAAMRDFIKRNPIQKESLN